MAFARIVDGDTLAIGETKIRLEGIDAPESDQLCLDRNAVKWNCGIAARDPLRPPHPPGQGLIPRSLPAQLVGCRAL